MRKTARLLLWLGGTASTPMLGTDVRPVQGAFVNVVAPPSTGNSAAVSRRATEAHFFPTASAEAVASLPPEARHLLEHRRVGQSQLPMRKFMRKLRADIYDELLKLPLRFALHDFDTLEAHLFQGGVRSSSGEEVSPGVYIAASASPREKTAVQGNSHTTSTNNSTINGGNEGEENGDDDVLEYAIAGRQPSSVGYAPPLGPADPLDVIPFFVHRTSTGLLPGRVRSMNNKNLMPAFFLEIGNVDGDIFRFEEELLKIFPTKKIFVRRHAVYVYNVNLDGKSILHHWLLGLGF